MNVLKWLYYYVPKSIKYGIKYKPTLNLLKKSRNWNKEQMQAYQLRKLKEILKYAYENVPYYKKVFDEVSFSPADFHSPDDLSAVPFLTKAIVREQQDKLLSKKAKKCRLVHQFTSGSTGEPAVFFCDKRETICLEEAFVMNAWQQIGYNGKGKMAVFRGNKIITNPSSHIFWSFNAPTHKTLYSLYDLNASNISYYYDNLIKEKTKWIHAFPSGIVRFCALAKQKGLPPITGVAGIMLSSEIIYDQQADLIRSMFVNAQLSYLYGHTEMACFAASCCKSLNYHFHSEYGFTEFIPIDSDTYEIVATGFNNHAMPIIRYRTGDVIRKSDICECTCHSPYPVVKCIGGRGQNSIITKSGTRIVETAFVAAVHTSAFDKIDKMQFEQFTDGRCVMRVKPLVQLSDVEKREILRVVTDRLNNDIDLQLEITTDIPLTNSGKNKLIIQHIKD